MLGLKLNHVSKRGHWRINMTLFKMYFVLELTCKKMEKHLIYTHKICEHRESHVVISTIRNGTTCCCDGVFTLKTLFGERHKASTRVILWWTDVWASCTKTDSKLVWNRFISRSSQATIYPAKMSTILIILHSQSSGCWWTANMNTNWSIQATQYIYRDRTTNRS